VQLPKDFVAKAERWKRGVPVPEPAPEAPPPPGEDPEEEVPTEMVDVGSRAELMDPAGTSDDEDEEDPTRPMRVPDSMRPPSNEAARPLRRPEDGEEPPGIPWGRALALGVAAALVGFAAVFLMVKLSRGTLEIVSSPPGAVVRLNGRTLDDKTPLQVRSLPGGSTYRVEVVVEGFRTWANDVPLKRGQHLVVDAVLEKAEPPKPTVETAPPAPPPKIETPPPPPPVPDAVKWPTGPFELDASKHRVDLSKAGALKLSLDEKQTYRITLSRGPSLGWGYYVVNAAGAAPGPLPTTPQQIKGATRLFVFRVPTSTLAGERRPEETKPRTLTVEAKGKPKTLKAPLSTEVASGSRVTLTGLNPKLTYEVLVRQSTSPARVRASGAIVSRCVVGHPTRGVLVAEVDKPLVVQDAAQLFFTLLDDASDDQDGRLLISVTEVKKPRR
jgi:eukaryotic-like serine/threonine-protein kinase